MTFLPSFQDETSLRDHQLKGLQWTVAHCHQNSAFYRDRLEQAGVRPGDVNSLDDLRRLPFTTAEDLRQGYPFPLLSVPLEQVVRVHASSGTTGKRKILAYSSRDVDDWANMMARCFEMAGLTREDRVQIAVGYGVWTAGVGFQLGCERFGALALPVGPGNLELQCQFLEDFGTTVLCSTSSMALLMSEEIRRRRLGDTIRLNRVVYGSERTSESMRTTIRNALGAELFDIPGLTELYGPGTGLECKAHQGIHYWADYYILEILDPETLEPVAPGEIGEMVVTTLRKEASPLIRYRTRDMTRLIPGRCECGCILPRHDRLLGRTDDMIKYRAVNIYPGQIDHVLSRFPEIGSEYRILLEHRDDGRDYMTIEVERKEGVSSNGDADIARSIGKSIKALIMVSAAIHVVNHGELPRTERKSKRVIDKRFNNNV
ncbi:MAG: phenylacetate--CoA ligase family protein [Desulfovibrionales bacterium]